jgi:hypothetical protein
MKTKLSGFFLEYANIQSREAAKAAYKLSRKLNKFYRVSIGVSMSTRDRLKDLIV